MDFFVCDGCGERLGFRLSTCPHCGRKLRLSQRIIYGDLFFGLVMTAVAVYIVAVGGFIVHGVWLVN